MIKSKNFTYIISLFCLIIVYGLFQIKDKVTAVTIDLAEANKQIEVEDDTIRVLKAELAYLTSSERLLTLSKKYLSLEETKTDQMVSNPLNNKINNDSSDIKLASENIINKKVNWRYKKGPTKYVSLASSKKIVQK